MSWWYSCSDPRCKNTRESCGRVFDAVLRLANGPPRACSRRGAPLQLRKTFPFALGAGSAGVNRIIKAAFEVHYSWNNAGKLVTVYDFLLIVADPVNKHPDAVFLPYWHDDGGKKKYGERAPHMAIREFKNLLRKAQSAGYL